MDCWSAVDITLSIMSYNYNVHLSVAIGCPIRIALGALKRKGRAG